MKKATLLAAMFVAVVAFADVTYYVSPGGDGTDPTSGDLTKAYAHPQTAIDAADGTTPTTVIIDDGTYMCQDNTKRDSVVTIDKSNITLKARNAGKVTIDGGTTDPASTFSLRRAITVNASLTGVAVEGLIFLNGISSSNGKKATTILASSGAFTDCEFHGYFMKRCNIYQLGGASVFTNCCFSPSSTALSAGDLDNYQMAISGNAKLVDCKIRDFKWWTGASGHVLSVNGAGVVLEKCEISGCTDGCPDGTDPVGAKDGVVNLTAGTLDGCVITNNICYGYGGGVYMASKNAVVKDCKIWGNHATVAGNDLYVASGVKASITGTAASDLTEDDLGNTDFDPFCAFCTVGNVMVGKAPFAVQFRNRTGEAATWDFGDGSAAEVGIDPVHEYATPGVYTVKMTVGDAETVVRADYIVATSAKMYVDKNGSGTKPYDTPEKAAKHPQDAIDLAPADAGTEIEIADGTYGIRDKNKDINVLFIDKGGLHVYAANGCGAVTLDAGTATSPYRVYRQAAIGKNLDNVRLSDLRLLNGVSSQYSGLTSAACIGSGAIENSTFEMYSFLRNPGVVLSGAAYATNCVFGLAKKRNIGACQASDIGVKLYGLASVVDSTFCNWDIEVPGYATYFLSLNAADTLVRNCVVSNAWVGKSNGTGAYGAVYVAAGTMESCTITDCHNRGGMGGGVNLGASAVFVNNIVWGNEASGGYNDIYAAGGYGNSSYSCASDLPAGENGNLNADPKFVTGTLVPDEKALCTGVGQVKDWMEGAHDFAGNPRLVKGTVTMGAFEPQTRSEGMVVDFSMDEGSSLGRAPLTTSFRISLSGTTPDGVEYVWDFGDGSAPVTTAVDTVTHEYLTPGQYAVSLSASKDGLEPASVIKAGDDGVTAVGEICYVRAADETSHPVKPYVSWETAATNIEEAFALKPSQLIVTNGTYRVDSETGLVLDYPVIVRSVEGPSVTTLDTGLSASIGRDYRHYLANVKHDEAVLRGFTLKRGSQTVLTASKGLVENCVVTNQIDANRNPVCNFSGTAVIRGCVFDGNGCSISDHVTSYGHMVYADGSALIDGCVVRNYNYNNGASGTSTNPQIAPVRLAASAQLRNSLIMNCSAVVFNVTPTGNTASAIIAAAGTKVHNCTITGNKILIGHAESKKLVYDEDVALSRFALCGGGEWCNNLVFGNTSISNTPSGYYGSATVFANNALDAGLDIPASATGSISIEDPCFADDGSGYRITSASPCYNAGARVNWAAKRGQATDIDGQERRCGPVDIGCWELQRPMGLTLLIR